MQARPPAKPARHSPEAQPMADGQGEAAWGTSGQVNADLRQIKTNPKINYERWGRGKRDRKTDVVRQRSEVK